MTDKTKISQVEQGQKITAMIIGSIVIILFIGIYYFTVESPKKITNTDSKLNFESPLDQVDTQSVVLERTQKQLRDTEKKTEKMQQEINQLALDKQSDNTKQVTMDTLSKKLEELEKQIKNSSQSNSDTPSSSAMQGGLAYQGNFLSSPSSQGHSNDNVEQAGMIREDSLVLTPSENAIKEPLKNPDTYVPSGTFVKAIVVGGADASASVSAQANPKVMLLRITENGTLPNHKKSHLKDCMVTGTVIGDISSERGSIKTERLSCVFMNNEVVEQEVVGMIFGPDGKVDVRGNLYEGGQQYVGRAFAAGTLSGFSEGLSQTYTANSISPEGNVQTINSGRIFQYGAAKGAGKAMDKVADYEIRKAEQFHPVIQLSAGTVVDIVFQKGFFLDGKNHEDSDKKSVGNYSFSNSPTLFPSSTESNDAQTLPLTPQAVARIEKYNKELGLRVTRAPSESLGVFMKRDLIMFLLLATAALTGCADMNAKLDCPMKPGVRCESIDQVNTRINRGEIGHDDTKIINNNASYLSSIKNEESIKLTSYKHVSNRKPLRYGETVQNIWIAPFEDTSGNYHQESNVYTIVKPGHWIGHPVKEMNDDEVN